MKKEKRKPSAPEKAEKKRRRQEFMTIFIHGKMKRVRRPLQFEGMDADEFILRNADPMWLHQNELWEEIKGDNVPLDRLFADFDRDIRRFMHEDRNT